jgi:hypothetical protein
MMKNLGLEFFSAEDETWLRKQGINHLDCIFGTLRVVEKYEQAENETRRNREMSIQIW